MRILHLASGDLWGGAEAQLCTLVSATAALSADVHVVTLNRGSQLGERLSSAGIPIHQLDERLDSTPKIAAQFSSLLKGLQPHIVHTHRFKENILGAAVAAASRIASVRTVHGAPEPELLDRSLRRRVLTLTDTLTARFLQKRTIAVSKQLAQQLERSLGGARIAVIENGVDPLHLRTQAALYADSVPTSEPGTFRLGFFGRLVSIKRVDLLLNAVCKAQHLSTKSIELFIVGEGPLLSRLQNMAADFGLTNSVRFVGFQSQSPSWIQSMHGIALTSDHEGMPMIVLEALALGVPIISRAVGGIPEVVTDPRQGLLVAGSDPVDFAHAICAVASRAEIVTGDTNLLPPRFHAEWMAKAHLRLYQEVLHQ